MTRGKWIGVVVGITIGIPVLIELLTLLGMIRVNLFEPESTKKPRRTDPASAPRRVGPGHSKRIHDQFTLFIEEFYIEANDSDWVFHMTAGFDHSSSDKLQIQSETFLLSSDETVDATQNIIVNPKKQELMTFETTIPKGSTPKTWTFTWSFQGSPNETSTSTVKFSKVPVRGEG